MRQNTSSRVDYYFACDDAGSAYHIAAFVAQKFEILIQDRKCEFKLGVPALRVFREFFSEQKFSKLVNVENITPHTKIAIIGTGHGFELQEINNAVNLGIPVLAVFDNWTNYENRLLLKGQKLNVRAILVTDDRALKLSQRINPDVQTIKVDNQIVEYFLNSKQLRGRKKRNLLILHQPLQKNLKRLYTECLHSDETANIIKNDIHVMVKLVKETVNFNEMDKVTVRVHPTFFSKYESLIDISNDDFQVSKNTLLEDLSNSSLVVGGDTYALYLSDRLKISTLKLNIDDY